MGMNRRKFLAVSSASALIAAVPVTGSPSVPSVPSGQTRFTAGKDHGDVLFLNGTQIEDIVIADICEGYVVQYVRDTNNRFTIEDRAIKSVRKYGQVQFVRRPYPTW